MFFLDDVVKWRGYFITTFTGILLRQDFYVKIKKAMKNTKTWKSMSYAKNTKAMKHIEKKTTLLSELDEYVILDEQGS